MNEIETYSDADLLALAAAEHFVALAAEAIAARGRFTVALAGGSTPRAAYALLASDEFAARPSTPLRTGVDWARVHVFWGDERCVPPDHPDSNYRMAREALLDKIPILADNVHRVRGELPPDQAAAIYQAELEAVLSASGRLDLILLGMGTDGHTASLFPGTVALEERELAVVAVYVERLQTWRVTLTLPAINTARQVLFLVTGAGKAETLQAVLEGPKGPYPAQRIRPTSGQLAWLVDTAAAGRLKEQV
jgi:6-phosphogluconolactonase